MTDGPRVGEVFAGRYRIEAILGEGGMGAVYRATDDQVGDVVALKILLEHGARAELTERFRREVRLARRITHPNVARIHDLGEHDGVLYLTMEYIRGRDLQCLVEEEGPMSPSRAAAIGAKIAEALAAIHAAGVVHRDLKPANVLLEEGGRVVLADFGIARAEIDRDSGFRTAGPIGTPIYMAPEQLTGAEVSPRTDLYSLGLVLYELATGKVPFLAATPMATALARLHQAPPDPRTASPRVSDALADLVLACLATDPSARPESASAVAAALDVIASDPTGPVTTPVALQATAMWPSTAPPRANTVSPGGRALAVLPFRYRGPDDHDYLGDALGDELIDLLSRTRGLTVLASGATQRFREERDPVAVGRELGADAVVDGTVQASAGRVRVSARLCDAKTGAQLWSERFDSPIADVFELQDRLGRRIAESLRVGISTTTSRGDTPASAIEAYLRARKQMRSQRWLAGGGAVVALLETCIAEAPDFGPALAAHAMGAIRLWFVQGGRTDRDWHVVAVESVARALERAPDIAETQLAASMLALHDGDLVASVKRVERALDIAPTYAEAHEFYGRLQCEGGKPEEGLRRLRLAGDLDPTLSNAWMDIARAERLLGNVEASDEAMAMLASVVTPSHPALLGLSMRFAVWSHDMDAVEALLPIAREGATPMHGFMTVYGEVARGTRDPALTIPTIRDRIEAMSSPRFRAVSYQMATEALTTCGDLTSALEFLTRASDSLLFDVVWMGRCRALSPLRALPDFARIASVVEARASAMWLG